MSVSTMVVNDGSALHEGMFQRLIELGIALSAERDTDRLLEMILLEAKRIPDADGGTLYLMGEEEKSLSFAIMRNDTLDIAMGGTTETEIPFPPLQLRSEEHTSELQSLMRNSYDVFCLKNKTR